MRRRRLWALIVCAVLALSLGASLWCVVRYSDHCCHSVWCPECQLLSECRQLFAMLGLGAAAALPAWGGRAAAWVLGVRFPKRPAAVTLVSLKVKLSD